MYSFKKIKLEKKRFKQCFHQWHANLLESLTKFYYYPIANLA
jgi:hypothetical protein